MHMLMQQVQEEVPTCGSCGANLDEDRDSVGICLPCEEEAKRKELLKQEAESRAVERSQYRHLTNSELVERAVRESNERTVILPNGDWYWRE